MILERCAELVGWLSVQDYDRAPEVLGRLKDYEVLVLCSRLQFVDYMGSRVDRFRKTVREYLSHRWGENMSTLS